MHIENEYAQERVMTVIGNNFNFKLLYKNINAEKIILDNDYKGNMISLLNPISTLYWHFEGSSFSRRLLTFQDSKDNQSIQVSDLIAGFLRDNGKLRQKYKDHVFTYRKNPKDEFDNLIKIFKK